MESRFLIKRSDVAGNGVFAAEEIKMGQTVHLLNGESCSLDEVINRIKAGKEEASDPLQVNGDEYLDLDEVSRTFNHSCGPNSYIKGRSELVAMRDIQKGEEIVYDYSTTMNDDEEKVTKAGRKLWTCKCNCGSENCRGMIDQFRTLPRWSQAFYIYNKYAPDFILKMFE